MVLQTYFVAVKKHFVGVLFFYKHIVVSNYLIHYFCMLLKYCLFCIAAKPKYELPGLISLNDH